MDEHKRKFLSGLNCPVCGKNDYEWAEQYGPKAIAPFGYKDKGFLEKIKLEYQNKHIIGCVDYIRLCKECENLQFFRNRERRKA